MTTFFKSTIVAATIALTSTAALANSNFGFQNTVMDNQLITLETVSSETDGYVVIYDYSKGAFGEILGQEEISEGANADVKIQLDPNNATAVAAVMYSGEITMPTEGAAWTELDVSNS